jgi:serine/threonine protein kinase
VMDFGIAGAVTAETVSETAAVVGTAAYLSPEQATGGKVDARTDIYALGVVLYEMLVGKPPFTGETPLAVAYKHLHDEPLPPSEHRPGLRASVDGIVARAMAKDPDERYVSAEEMRNDLDRSLGDGFEPERRAPISEGRARETLGRRLWRLRWALLAVLLLGLAFSVPLLASGGSSPRDLDIEERPTPSVLVTASPQSGAGSSGDQSPDAPPSESPNSDQPQDHAPAEEPQTTPSPSPSPAESPTAEPSPSPTGEPSPTPPASPSP